MIRALRRRFVLGAMAAFAILMVLLVGGVTLASYLRAEGAADAFLKAMLEGEEVEVPPEGEGSGMSFGYRLEPHAPRFSYYSVLVDADGGIAGVEEKGIWEPDYDLARSYAAQLIASKESSGKIGAYKYRVSCGEDGGARVILMDNSLQIRMLGEILRTAALVSLACLGALFVILLPVSGRVVRSYAANIEKQKQFITNAGHEIKTPVAIIMSNVDAMELIQGENRWSRNIRGQTERLSALLQRMLFMARIDERSVALPSETVELNALVRAEIEPYEEPMREKGIRFDCVPCAPLRVRGSREYLQQLAHMLLDNAVQYVNEGGVISLKLERRRGRARVALYNSVERLPDCPPEALFDRFYRGDSARTQKGGGYGIGLSAACAIAEMHRGRIVAEYEGERGIRFTVELPVRP